MNRMLGIIGGSGIYDIKGLEEAAWVRVSTPWGPPSDEVLCGRLSGLPVAFLPRHGRGHVHSPTSVPYRANVDALKRIGCTEVLALSAVGSLREDFAPGDFVRVDQYIDRTVAREKTFFEAGCVAHVAFAHPTCARLGEMAATAARAAGKAVHDSATYLAMEGPLFSTLAESRLYRQWGADVIGMTGMPEAKLAREAELCYASLAMVTDFDCWHPDHDAVDITAVIATLGANSEAGKATVAGLAAALEKAHAPCPCGCNRALDHALMTAPDKRDTAALARLDAVAGRVLGRAM